MENTTIEWADHTFNGWIGCTQVSPGCLNCYALTQNKRWAGGKNWGKGAKRDRTSEDYWKQPLKWNKNVWAQCPKCGVKQPHGDVCIVPDCLTLGQEMQRVRPRVFCASLSDWLDDEVPIEWLADLIQLIHDTPNLDWLLLTKRPENWKGRLEALRDWLFRRSATHDHLHDRKPFLGYAAHDFVDDWLRGRFPANIWIGTSVEDQARADERIPQLLAIPAKVRFLSCEPLLDAVRLESKIGVVQFADTVKHFDDSGMPPLVETGLDSVNNGWRKWGSNPGIHWVICGGESGPGARPMHPDWARSLRDQCTAASVAFHFKQWGEWLPGNQFDEDMDYPEPKQITKLALDGTQGNEVTMPRDKRGGMKTLCWIGKRAAGRLLDGKEWNEVPA